MQRPMTIFFIALFYFGWFSYPADAQAPRKVKMTIPVIAHSMTPVFLAQNKGFFTEEKLEVDITSTGGGGPDIRALIAGDVEFSFTTGDNVILAQQEGKKLLMVMSGLHRLFINWAMHKDVAKTKGEDPSIPEFLMENLIIRPETATKDPDLVRRMVRALTKANKWALQSTPEQVADGLKPSMTTIAPDLLLAGVKSVLPALSQDGRTTERSAQTTQALREQAGILKKRVPYAEIVSNEFLAK